MRRRGYARAIAHSPEVRRALMTPRPIDPNSASVRARRLLAPLDREQRRALEPIVAEARLAFDRSEYVNPYPENTLEWATWFLTMDRLAYEERHS